jgi:hypothetical protein
MFGVTANQEGQFTMHGIKLTKLSAKNLAP